VTAGPSEAVGLVDRGRLATGRRGDMILVRLHDGVPTVRGVYCLGRRIG
jgi:alpha-D-ribose 1-methylphosphonate 5-triphosphate diphosphatase